MHDDLEKVLGLPARFIDVTFQQSSVTNITTKDGVAKDISVGNSAGFGVRVLDSVWGFASTNDPKGLIDAAEKALKAAKAAKKEIPFLARDGTEDRVRTKVRIPPQDVDLEEKVGLGRRAFDSIRDEKRIVSSSFTYIDSSVEGLYANSEGSRIEWESMKVAFIANIFAKEGGALQLGSERAGASSGFEFLKEPELIAKRAAEKAIRLLEARSAPSGRFTVVLDPLLTGVFIHEALGHAVEADLILQGDSILGGRLGETVASELVSIYDDPTIEGAFGSYPYDSEGTRAQKTILIERGGLKSYLHSRETASSLGMENTANARSQGFDHLPIVRMSNTIMEPGEQKLEELVEDVDYGVYLLGSKGGEVDPAKGVFQFSAEEGFLIEKGMITTPLKDVALSGETLKILKGIDGVGKGFDSNIGFCGKEGQSIPVGDGGVHIRTVAAVGGAGD